MPWECEECGTVHHAEAECCQCDGEGWYETGDNADGVASARSCDCPAGDRSMFEGMCGDYAADAFPARYAAYVARKRAA